MPSIARPEIVGVNEIRVGCVGGIEHGERNVTLELSEAGRSYLAKKGYDKDFGARPLARLIQDELKRPLGDELLFGKLEHGGHVVVDHDCSKIRFELTSRDPPEPKKAEVTRPSRCLDSQVSSQRINVRATKARRPGEDNSIDEV